MTALQRLTQRSRVPKIAQADDSLDASRITHHASSISPVNRVEAIAVFSVITAVFLAEAAWLAFVVGFMPGDALSRTYSALVAVRSADPHLAAIGFAWPPLPVLLQIPLVLLPRLTHYGLSGGVVSAIVAGLTAVALCLLLARAGLSRWQRWLAIALFFVNPLIAFYAGTGMSEMPFLCGFVFGVYCYLRWTDDERWGWLVGAALATGLMVLSRYEAIAFAFAVAVALVVLLAGRYREAAAPRAEASLLAYAAPVGYVVLLWVFFNWQILGDPFFFARGEYSQAYLMRFAGDGGEVLRIRGSWLEFGRYVLRIALTVAPALPFAAVLLLATPRRRVVAQVCLLVVLLSIPAFQLLSYRQGQTFGFLRYYITLAPAGLVITAELVRAARSRMGRRLALGVLFAGLAAGIVTATTAALGPNKPPTDCPHSAGDVEYVLIRALAHPVRLLDTCGAERRMAAYIRERIHSRAVIADNAANAVVVFSGHPERFALLSDRDFEDFVRAPSGGTKHVLTTKENLLGFHPIVVYFPQLTSDSPAGMTLVYSTGSWRLYRIEAP